jgi:hypothetical protein
MPRARSPFQVVGLAKLPAKDQGVDPAGVVVTAPARDPVEPLPEVQGERRRVVGPELEHQGARPATLRFGDQGLQQSSPDSTALVGRRHRESLDVRAPPVTISPA